MPKRSKAEQAEQAELAASILAKRLHNEAVLLNLNYPTGFDAYVCYRYDDQAIEHTFLVPADTEPVICPLCQGVNGLEVDFTRDAHGVKIAVPTPTPTLQSGEAS